MIFPKIQHVNSNILQKATQALDSKTKPIGSLGIVEELAKKICAIQDTVNITVDPGISLIFAGDHGVANENVSAYPQEVTQQMVANISDGRAAIGVLSNCAGLALWVVDAGVVGDSQDRDNVLVRRTRNGTRNLMLEPAMTVLECEEAVNVGIDVARDAVLQGYKCFVLGEMGIGNTTSAAAIIAAILDIDPAQAVGPGTGVKGCVLEHKRQVVAHAIERAGTHDAWTSLLEFGGYEICGLVGAMFGGASNKTPMVVDGVIASAAALVACKLCPAIQDFLFFGHLSPEPSHKMMLDALGEEPILDLKLRLGEGTGAALAYMIVRAAAKIMTDMATFESAGVSGELS